jgi:competence protein ComGC
MSKQLKILLILLIIAILLVLYLIMTAKTIERDQDKTSNQADKINLEQLENRYKDEVKNIFVNYSELIKDENFDVEQIRSIKNQLLDLRVPTKFKDLHLQFVLAITKMEDFLQTGDKEEKINSQQMINEIKVNYVWLN